MLKYKSILVIVLSVKTRTKNNQLLQVNLLKNIQNYNIGSAIYMFTFLTKGDNLFIFSQIGAKVKEVLLEILKNHNSLLSKQLYFPEVLGRNTKIYKKIHTIFKRFLPSTCPVLI